MTRLIAWAMVHVLGLATVACLLYLSGLRGLANWIIILGLDLALFGYFISVLVRAHRRRLEQERARRARPRLRLM